eukprot:s5809_g8.t1
MAFSRRLRAPLAAWSNAPPLLRHAERRSFSNSANSADPSAGERAKKAQELWRMMVPEQHWDFRSPMIPTLILFIVFLQYLISQKQSDVAEKEREEVRLLQDERRARRAASEKALEE